MANFDKILVEDFHYFTNQLQIKNELNVDSLKNLASELAAKFFYQYYSQFKKIDTPVINAIMGVLSNEITSTFPEQINQNAYEEIAQKALEKIRNPQYVSLSQNYFEQLLASKR